jgi:two-component system KDP operon response regulator KdpE
MKILVIEDDQAIIETITLSFLVGWPEVEIYSAKLGAEGIELVESLNPELLILDLGLPDINGFEVIKNVRLFSNVPIIVLTQNEDEKAVVKALGWGADDYIIKPFRQMELLARIKSLLRRKRGETDASETFGPFILNFAQHQLTYKGKSYNLTRVEFQIFNQLARNMGHIVSKDSLAQNIWEGNYPDSANAIRVHVRHLREKIEINPDHPELIITKPGIGYMLSYPPLSK